MNTANTSRFFDPSAPQTLPPKEKKASPPMLSILLGVLLLTSVAASGFFYLRAKNLSAKIPPLGCHYEEVQCIMAPCDPVLVCPSPVSPTPEISPKPTALSSPTVTPSKPRTDFGSPKWTGKLISITSPSVFKDPNGDKPTDNGMYLGKARFYKVADLSGGASLIDVFIPTEGMGITDTLIRIIKDGDKFYYLSRNLSQWDRDNYSKIFKTEVSPLDNEFKEIHIPDYLSADGKNYKKIWATPSTFDTLKNPVKIFDTDYGTIYATYSEQAELSGIQERSLYLKLKDTTLVNIDLAVPFYSDDRVPYVYFSESLTTPNKLQYSHGLGFGKCGASNGLTVFKDDQGLLINKMLVGNDSYNGTGNGIYQVKDPSSKLLATLYQNYKVGREYPSAPPILSFEEFVTKPTHFVWKDKMGEWNIFLNSEYSPMAECGKPVIYLYPSKESNVNVKVSANISISEPLYTKDGWSVVAKPDSTLVSGNKSYPYLFWEGQGSGLYPDYRHLGTVVSADKLETTLKTQLQQLGLNPQESADFVEFWLPKMPKTPYVRLTWLGTADMDRLAPLTVDPAPDTQIRIFLEFEGLSKPVKLTAQKLSAPVRQGFTLVEWGGLLFQSK